MGRAKLLLSRGFALPGQPVLKILEAVPNPFGEARI
jgi:hypothetical protein